MEWVNIGKENMEMLQPSLISSGLLPCLVSVGNSIKLEPWRVPTNSLYGPAYERMGLHADPVLLILKPSITDACSSNIRTTTNDASTASEGPEILTSPISPIFEELELIRELYRQTHTDTATSASSSKTVKNKGKKRKNH
ncbi:uncharacterized protein LOC143849015 [Tasmannia lanceolata]|uniref:uncharacterized protein LOC143849015 n=1 Tax=Tasmannia lanceolata TaxID=3420 RepID=UPI0040637BD3